MAMTRTDTGAALVGLTGILQAVPEEYYPTCSGLLNRRYSHQPQPPPHESNPHMHVHTQAPVCHTTVAAVAWRCRRRCTRTYAECGGALEAHPHHQRVRAWPLFSTDGDQSHVPLWHPPLMLTCKRSPQPPASRYQRQARILAVRNDRCDPSPSWAVPYRPRVPWRLPPLPPL